MLEPRIRDVHSRVLELQGRLGQLAEGQHPALDDAIDDVHLSLDELRVADEGLRQLIDDLALAHRRYENLFRDAPDAYLVTDLDGIIREANRAAGLLFNAMPSFLVGRSLHLLIADEDRDQFRQVARLDLGTSAREWEGRLCRLDGRLVDVVLTVVAQPGRPGQPAELSWLIHDVTERKRTEAERAQLLERERVARAEAEAARRQLEFLAEAGDRLASSLDYEATLTTAAHLPIPTLADSCVLELVDDNSIVTTIVAARWPRVEAQVRELRRWLPPHLDNPKSLVARALHTGMPVLLQDASSIQKLLNAAALRVAEARRALASLPIGSLLILPLVARGRILGVMSLIAPTPDRYGEAELRLARELAHRCALAIDNGRLYREAREAVRVRNEFLASVSHDLKNPLTVIKGYAQMLRGDPARRQVAPPGTVDDSAQKIERTAERAIRQLNELLDLSRYQAGQPLVLNRRRVDLVALARNLVEEYRDGAPRHHLCLVAPTDEIVGEWDDARLERVVSNLLANAIKYSPSGGEIRLTLWRELGGAPSRPGVVLEVQDAGIGIPRTDLPRIFEEFYRGRNVGRVPGTGLGLAGVRSIVESHGGTISVRSEEGLGAAFTVWLPLASS